MATTIERGPAKAHALRLRIAALKTERLGCRTSTDAIDVHALEARRTIASMTFLLARMAAGQGSVASFIARRDRVFTRGASNAQLSKWCLAAGAVCYHIH